MVTLLCSGKVSHCANWPSTGLHISATSHKSELGSIDMQLLVEQFKPQLAMVSHNPSYNG